MNGVEWVEIMAAVWVLRELYRWYHERHQRWHRLGLYGSHTKRQSE